jgi:hypothetical protein
VLRYEKPRGYKNPLDSRAQRTIFGIALFLFPTFVYWSIVNISFKPVFSTPPTLPQITEAPTSTIQLTQTPTIVYTITSDINTTETIAISTPTIEALASPTDTVLSETLTPTATETPSPTGAPNRNLSPEEEARQEVVFEMFMYYILGLPFILFIFGLVIYACINSLMPIVHVELLDDYE